MALQLAEVSSGVEFRARPDKPEYRWTSGPGNMPPPTRDANGNLVPYTATNGVSFYQDCADDVGGAVVCFLTHDYQVLISTSATP